MIVFPWCDNSNVSKHERPYNNIANSSNSNTYSATTKSSTTNSKFYKTITKNTKIFAELQNRTKTFYTPRDWQRNLTFITVIIYVHTFQIYSSYKHHTAIRPDWYLPRLPGIEMSPCPTSRSTNIGILSALQVKQQLIRQNSIILHLQQVKSE